MTWKLSWSHGNCHGQFWSCHVSSSLIVVVFIRVIVIVFAFVTVDIFVGHVMSPHHSDQMSFYHCHCHGLVVIVIVLVIVIVFLLVRSCLLFALIT